MTKKTKKTNHFLETSGVIYSFHGDRRMKAEVSDAVQDGKVWVSTFIRMEYLRGVIFNLINLYFVVKEEDSVHDALVYWTQTKFNQPRKFIVALVTIAPWLESQDDPNSKSKSLRRLGEMIVRLVRDFDDKYPLRIKDNLECCLGKVGFDRTPFDEDMLLGFYERFKSIRSGDPSCSLCRFKATQERRMVREKRDLHGASQQTAYVKNTGYVTQAKRLTDLAKKVSPKCSICENVGDSIIATHYKAEKFTLVTADKSFLAFATILGLKIHKLRSLAEIAKIEKATSVNTPVASNVSQDSG